MRRFVLTLVALVAFTAAAAADAAAPPPDHSAEVAAAMQKAVKAGDAKAIAATLATRLVYFGISTPDAGCDRDLPAGDDLAIDARIAAVARCLPLVEGIGDFAFVGRVAPDHDVLPGGGSPGTVYVYVPRGAQTATMIDVWSRAGRVSPEIVPPNVLSKLRVSGTVAIPPDDKTRKAIAKSGKTRVIASVKLCLKDTGAIASVNMVKSSGFPDYDGKLLTAVAAWKFKPYTVDGAAKAVCTAYTFIYQQH